jgi:hypothetical protein
MEVVERKSSTETLKPAIFSLTRISFQRSLILDLLDALHQINLILALELQEHCKHKLSPLYNIVLLLVYMTVYVECCYRARENQDINLRGSAMCLSL